MDRDSDDYKAVLDIPGGLHVMNRVDTDNHTSIEITYSTCLYRNNDQCKSDSVLERYYEGKHLMLI